ncbi:hypothetical protein D9758_000969 [Tetrapyrgos nigripes]|uniref:Uncharacterized protein n=1 Tax=Tetrapyrgos nigripes TaxID=182062 RepID=A0A8H5GYY0_9AGAR|nr:hypothetical protein D9758_000969 [Tetrapyrgos nigripes]
MAPLISRPLHPFPHLTPNPRINSTSTLVPASPDPDSKTASIPDEHWPGPSSELSAPSVVIAVQTTVENESHGIKIHRRNRSRFQELLKLGDIVGVSLSVMTVLKTMCWSGAGMEKLKSYRGGGKGWYKDVKRAAMNPKKPVNLEQERFTDASAWFHYDRALIEYGVSRFRPICLVNDILAPADVGS